MSTNLSYRISQSLEKSNFWEAGLLSPPKVDRFDAFSPNVTFCSKHSCYRNVWVESLPSVPQGKWDTVLACEVIEHIKQDVVEEALDRLEGICNKLIIVSTPNWLYYRGGSDTILGYNDLESHLSYISRSYLYNRGYRLISAGFGNPIHPVVRAIKKLRLKIPFEALLESLPKLFPSTGISLIAYKDIV